jgi:hypothetical protein
MRAANAKSQWRRRHCHGSVGAIGGVPASSGEISISAVYGCASAQAGVADSNAPRMTMR